ncbi:MAG: hypothetical protein M3H12_20750 [Chromatiales bacterium]|nr:hypothetical protein [Gammaproteobacteria bacterium]
MVSWPYKIAFYGIIVPAILLGIWGFFSGVSKTKTDEGRVATISIAPTSQQNIAVVEQVLEKLLTQDCPDLYKYRADFKSMKADIEPGWSSDKDEYGWDPRLVLTIVVKDSPQHIPTTYRAWGHHIRYYMGGGQRPGITTPKEVGHRLCGRMRIDPMANSFLYSDSMQVIDQIH